MHVTSALFWLQLWTWPNAGTYFCEISLFLSIIHLLVYIICFTHLGIIYFIDLLNSYRYRKITQQNLYSSVNISPQDPVIISQNF